MKPTSGSIDRDTKNAITALNAYLLLMASGMVLWIVMAVWLLAPFNSNRKFMRTSHRLFIGLLSILSVIAAILWPYAILMESWINLRSYVPPEIPRMNAPHLCILKNQLYTQKRKQATWSAMRAWPAH